ncbi:hypothetical protein MAC_08926 [Metarhizium acridum CQMa 102]|uniref:Uncharacterized protein n=1 Tax=Metarhizium acridum (strain CQMa 102) TaxID=655827 RepID=E9EGC8_METAQ|nr:uncharacterized protein MAC_08926 [Metarhizium acridum CQMa 102]EFY85043.1 hypothetical protein MAC_08926 [Metarhizium acridum CQMa 102]
MYPDWPESEADLVPLPQFRFPYDYDWEGPPAPATDDYDCDEYRELFSALYNYADPFTCECRAFGRLQESGHETVALKCYSYVLLDEEHERTVMAQFPKVASGADLDFTGSGDYPGLDELRSRFLGKSGRPPPIRGIVKELGVADEDNLRPAVARNVLRDIIRLQKLGIIGIDVRDVQIVSGKLCDFSTAVTTPHFLTTPEINPHLTADMVSLMELATFSIALQDYKSFDDMIREWNLFMGKARRISITAFPGGRGSELPYNLRNKAAKERIFTYVDPRSYDWRMRGANLETNGGDTIRRRRSDRISNVLPEREGVPRREGISRTRRPLTSTPSLWHFDCRFRPVIAAKLRAGNPPGVWLQWYLKDGFLFPYEVRDCWS